MSTCVEKFIESMNRVSPWWHVEDVEIIAQNGKIVAIKHRGFSWIDDTETKKGGADAR